MWWAAGWHSALVACCSCCEWGHVRSSCVDVRARVADEAVVKRGLGSARKIANCYCQLAGELGGY